MIIKGTNTKACSRIQKMNLQAVRNFFCLELELGYWLRRAVTIKHTVANLSYSYDVTVAVTKVSRKKVMIAIEGTRLIKCSSHPFEINLDNWKMEAEDESHSHRHESLTPLYTFSPI